MASAGPTGPATRTQAVAVLSDSDLASKVEVQPGRFIYVGLTAKVARGRLRDTDEAVAIKRVDKSRLTDASEMTSARNEIEIHRSLRHPCISPLLLAVESRTAFVLVTPLMPAGDLHEATKFSTIRECDCRNFADQLLHALGHLHGRGVLHGDVKPHNVLLCKLGGRATIRLCDFGLSQCLALTEAGPSLLPFSGLRGTPGYFSPEALQQRSYGCPADLWAVGITLFKLLAGYEAFYPASAFEQGVIFEEEHWGIVTGACKDLLHSLLCLDPEGRPTAAEALGHAWLHEELPEQPPAAATEERTLFGPPPPSVMPFFAFRDLPPDVHCPA